MLPHAPLLFLLAARLALGLAFSQAVPTWEAPQEDSHFFAALALARRSSPAAPARTSLYYWLIAPLIAAFDLEAGVTGPARNPYFAAGSGNLNYALHPAALTGPERSLAWAVQTARGASVVLSTLSVVCVYLAARRLWPGDGRAA